MPTTEAIITRKFGISFIDARTIVTEARLQLDIHGYPSQEEKEQIVKEASYIFEMRYGEETRRSMQAHRMSLDDAKASQHSQHEESFSSSETPLDLSIRSNSSNKNSDASHHSTSSSVKRNIRIFLRR